MSKFKSALALTALAILIAVLCFVCTVSFPMGNDYFNSVISRMTKDADLGGASIDGGYLGGGYVAMYYPEGVISAKEYIDNRDGIADDDKRDEYIAKYTPSESGALYFEIEKVCDEEDTTKLSEEFKTSFEETLCLIKARYESMHVEDARLEVVDGYTVRISLPRATGSTGAIYQALAYTGDMSIGVGSSAASATTIMPKSSREDDVITDYVSSISTRTDAAGTAYVVINFTSKGAEILQSQTADAASSPTTMYFKLGDNAVISLSVSTAIEDSSLYISGSYTTDSAKAVALALDTSLDNTGMNAVSFTVTDLYSFEANYGSDALLLLYITFAVLFAGMTIFFAVRYHGLVIAHLISFLLFFFPMVLCMWAISFINLTVETFVALMLAGAVLSVSNAVSYEYARKEYSYGKTMVSSVKTGYKKCFWHIFDIHIVLAVLGFITYFISLTSLAGFAFTFALGICFSGVCSLAINRFAWAATLAQTKRSGAFSNFKRTEEVEDE